MRWKMPVTSRPFWGPASFGAADEACRPNEDGWTGLLIITELLRDLLTRAGEEA